MSILLYQPPLREVVLPEALFSMATFKQGLLACLVKMKNGIFMVLFFKSLTNATLFIFTYPLRITPRTPLV